MKQQSKRDVVAGPNKSPQHGRLIQTATDPQPPQAHLYPNINSYWLDYDRWASARKKQAKETNG